MPYSEPARVRVMMNKLGMEEAEKVKTYEEAEKFFPPACSPSFLMKEKA